jgi:hypothetical protein
LWVSIFNHDIVKPVFLSRSDTDLFFQSGQTKIIVYHNDRILRPGNLNGCENAKVQQPNSQRSHRVDEITGAIEIRNLLGVEWRFSYPDGLNGRFNGWGRRSFEIV